MGLGMVRRCGFFFFRFSFLFLVEAFVGIMGLMSVIRLVKKFLRKSRAFCAGRSGLDLGV